MTSACRRSHHRPGSQGSRWSAVPLLPVLALWCCASPMTLRGPEQPALAGVRVPKPESMMAFPEPSGKRALLAIVIDDVGENFNQIEPFLDIPLPISFSVLSAASRPVAVARTLAAQGRDVLAHVPMEPVSADFMAGSGFLMTSMTTRKLLETLQWNLDQVPGAVGVNNHMGSRFTRDEYAMAVVLEFLKEQGLYFLDSRTDPKTVARTVAERIRLPFLERDVFLDNDPRETVVERMLQEAVGIARERGCAIAIGHPRQNTAAVLRRFALDPARVVDVIPVSRLAGHPCRPDVPGSRRER